jgi:riboflavin kinase/FMN adenylyltransferase
MMRVSYYPDVDLRGSARPAVTLGNFDGVHLGHQRALALLKERARALRAPAIAVTFEPHPVSVLRPDNAPKRILTPRLKQEVIAAQSIDHLVVIHFTREFSRVTAEEFVSRVLVEKLHVAELVLGANFRFGHGREGDLQSLRSLGERLGFVVHQVEASEHGGEIISSSRIRRSLEEGAVDEAAAMLGRPHFFEGDVVRGDGRGKLMGFPTANLKVDGDVLVADGVYVTEATVSEALVRSGRSRPICSSSTGTSTTPGYAFTFTTASGGR